MGSIKFCSCLFVNRACLTTCYFLSSGTKATIAIACGQTSSMALIDSGEVIVPVCLNGLFKISDKPKGSFTY